MSDYEVLEDLSAALDRAAGMDPVALADGESIVELHRALARLEAIATRAAAAFDAAGEWEADGARSPAAWISVRCRMPKAVAGRRVRLARSLRHLPVAERAWSAGDIGVAHVAALAGARTAATAAAMARDEKMLVGQAADLRHDRFLKVLAYWSQHADPDGTEANADRQRDDRRFYFSPSFAGTWLGDLVLDPISGTVVHNQLRRIEDELFDADWAEARERLGDDVCAAALARTPAQRRADALVEMARRAGTAPPDARRPEPLFTVLVGYETFAGHLRAVQRHRGQPRGGGRVARRGVGRAGGVRRSVQGHRRGRDPPASREPPDGRSRPCSPSASTSSATWPPSAARWRPRRALCRRRAHGHQERPTGVPVPQPQPPSTTRVAAAGMSRAGARVRLLAYWDSWPRTAPCGYGSVCTFT